MPIQTIPLIALNGDFATTPASTLEGLWSALGAGAQGLCLNVFLTQDRIVVCTPNKNLQESCGENIDVADITAAELVKKDAGATWRSSVLDREGQPTGQRGEDTPWNSIGPDHRRTYHPTLDEVLQRFGRRTSLLFCLPSDNDTTQIAVIDRLLEQLTEWGLNGRAIVIGSEQACRYIRSFCQTTQLALDLSQTQFESSYASACVSELDCNYLVAAVEWLGDDNFLSSLNESLQDIRWLFISHRTVFTPTPDSLLKLMQAKVDIAGLLVQGLLAARELIQPPVTVLADSFAGKEINTQQWAAGYSRDNDDTTIYQDDAFIVDIRAGGHYSGGGIVTKIPTHGDFDALVDFGVAVPHQGTTFEMAAICIDPGYHKINLTFDVHGAPPYASSERDEDDGFRCGWNNSFNLTAFDGYKASSSNLYNNYGRDVGYGKKDSPEGQLRLTRRGQVFNSYYRDKFNRAWVCSGTMLVQNMAQDCFIRLAAKHWKKKNPEPPGNTVLFKNFVLRQF